MQITPAGDGKLPLDGMFGRLGSCLSTTVDLGHSHYDDDSTSDALKYADGLASTTQMKFEPCHSNAVKVKSASLKFGPILLMTLFFEGTSGPFTLCAYKHSGFGAGLKLDPVTDNKFYKKENNERLFVYNPDVHTCCSIKQLSLSCSSILFLST